jgi:hypothetical protein
MLRQNPFTQEELQSSSLARHFGYELAKFSSSRLEKGVWAIYYLPIRRRTPSGTVDSSTGRTVQRMSRYAQSTACSRRFRHGVPILVTTGEPALVTEEHLRLLCSKILRSMRFGNMEPSMPEILRGGTWRYISRYRRSALVAEEHLRLLC